MTFDINIQNQYKLMIGLNNVDNTSDINKPISNTTQSALNLKASLISPAFTGTVTVNGNNIVLSNDSRLSDTRIPSPNSVTNDSIASNANIEQSKILNLTTDLANKAPLASPEFIGTVTVNGNNIVLSNDSRLSNTRIPSTGSVTNDSIASNANIEQSKILNLTTDLATKASLASPVFTGTVTVNGNNIVLSNDSRFNKYYIMMSLNTTQNINTNTTTIILWDKTTKTYGNTINYNTSDGKFTIPVTGLWEIQTTINFSSPTAWNRFTINIVTSNSSIPTITNQSGKYGFQRGSYNAATLSLNINDTVWITCLHNSSTSPEPIDSNSWVTLTYYG